MNDGIANVMVHVNENMDETALHEIEDELRGDRGIVSVGHNPDRPHLLLVAYDSNEASSSSFMHSFQEHGLHAQLVGL